MNLELIKKFAEERHIPFKVLAQNIGMSEGNLHRCVRENKIQATDLEKIAIILNVNVGDFFADFKKCVRVESHGKNSNAAGRDINIGYNDGELARLQDMIAHLEERLADKEAAIAEKDNRIADKDEIIKILKTK